MLKTSKKKLPLDFILNPALHITKRYLLCLWTANVTTRRQGKPSIMNRMKKLFQSVLIKNSWLMVKKCHQVYFHLANST